MIAQEKDVLEFYNKHKDARTREDWSALAHDIGNYPETEEYVALLVRAIKKIEKLFMEAEIE